MKKVEFVVGGSHFDPLLMGKNLRVEKWNVIDVWEHLINKMDGNLLVFLTKKMKRCDWILNVDLVVPRQEWPIPLVWALGDVHELVNRL